MGARDLTAAAVDVDSGSGSDSVPLEGGGWSPTTSSEVGDWSFVKSITIGRSGSRFESSFFF